MPRHAPKQLPVLTAAAARRWLLACQGMLDDPARRATPKTVYSLIERIGFVQLDSINVVERAHHLTLFSRMHQYRPAMLTTLLEENRQLWEHWTHDASAIPSKWFGHWRHRFERYRARIKDHAWWKLRLGPNPEKTVREVRDRIARDGPLLSKDFQNVRPTNGELEEGWWSWKPQKAALEYLWRSGELAVRRRVNFQKEYDLMERVLPQYCTAPAPRLDDHVDWACRSALDRLGGATPAEIAAFWHAIDLAQARQWCQRTAQSGEIVQVLIQSADGARTRPGYAVADFEQRIRRLPSPPPGVRLLSPFDPILRDRRRTVRLFGFDYAFEAFVPAPKRRYGYYVLPILQSDRLIGRMDLKHHRERNVLHVKGLWWENSIKPTKAKRASVVAAIEALARFVGASNVCIQGESHSLQD